MASTVSRFLVRYSFTRSVTTSFGGRAAADVTSGRRVSGLVDGGRLGGACTVTTGPTATPGCAASGGRGRW